jgi:Na+-transporting NADH:ubiquinone oxidoreductase subunit F
MIMPWVRKIHKWASVIVGIQFLLWLSSGIYFNLMDHTKAAGRAYMSQSTANVHIEPSRLIEPKAVLTKFQPSLGLTTTTLLKKPFYLLTHKKGLYPHLENNYTLVDAYTGRQVIIDNVMANALAKQSYNGPGRIRSTRLLSSSISDFPKQRNPTWQVNFDDEVDTSVYVEAGSGRIVGHSDSDKRLADIFFMLHFMDYFSEGGFNNLQMILFAFVSLWLSFTGLIWTVDLGFRGQYKIKLFAKKRTIKLFDEKRKSMGSVKFSTHTNLLDGLADHDIILPSTCGGGGTCGRCKVMISPSVNATSADQLHFSHDELAQGLRLACQHFSDDIRHMTLMDVTNAAKHTLELMQSRFVSPFIKELRFKVKNGYRIPYQAGAFMRFFIPAGNSKSIPLALPDDLKSHWQHVKDTQFDHDACTRSYSCAASAMATDELVFTIKIQSAPHDSVRPGLASHYLGDLEVGNTVETIGPFEEFAIKPSSDKNIVLIGAGSGMAPLKSLIEEQMVIHHQDPNTQPVRQIHFFYGARTELDLLYWDDFYQLAEHNDNFHYYPILSRPDEQWPGATGYAQHILALELGNLGDIHSLEFYLCGPQGLMDNVISLLMSKGVKEDDIRFDVFK